MIHQKLSVWKGLNQYKIIGYNYHGNILRGSNRHYVIVMQWK